MKKYLIILSAFVFTLSSCNDDFMDKVPTDKPTEETAFTTYNTFKSYMWPCYAMFTNTTIATAVNTYGGNSHYRGDFWAGYLNRKDTYNPYAFQTITSTATGNGWDFSYIRLVNIMLSHVDDPGASLTTAQRNHWRAVGYFFHAYWYMELINRFGDVPWVNKVLDDASPETYGARTPRKEVADSVLARLKWAENNIGDFTADDGANTINQNCVRAALSRFALREGTWRKYHNLGDYNTYFAECERVSKLLMASYPTLYTGTDGQPAAGYGEMWTTEDLGSVPGVILYKQYLENYIYATFCHFEHTSSHTMEMSQDMIDMYLCKDGLTISNSALYNGDRDMYSTFRNRDPRLYHTVIPPYKVVAGGANKPAGNLNATWGYTSNPADREYIDIMGPNESCSNPGVGMKRLPGQNWGASLVPQIPNFVKGTAGTTKAFVSCRSGYYTWKNWDNWERNYNQGYLNTADKPIFKIEEVLLNYAEAMWEQGKFTQAAADESINKLRARAGVANMVVANIDANFDPKRGRDDDGNLIDPVLWEIRRERIIELMCEGFGFYDVRRWKCAKWFINRQQKGMWIKRTDVTAAEKLLNETTHLTDDSLTEGYVYLWADPVNTEGKGWLDKYYLYQVPTNEIALNPALAPNNPGWE